MYLLLEYTDCGIPVLNNIIVTLNPTNYIKNDHMNKVIDQSIDRELVASILNVIAAFLLRW